MLRHWAFTFDFVAGGPVVLCEFLSVDWFEVVEVEGEEFVLVAIASYGGIDAGDEIEADVVMQCWYCVVGELFVEMQGGVFDGEGDVDVAFLVVVAHIIRYMDGNHFL